MKTCGKKNKNVLAPFFLNFHPKSQHLLSFIVRGEAFCNLLCEASMFLVIAEPKQVVSSNYESFLKGKSTESSAFMSTFLTAAVRVAQVLIRAAQRSLCRAQVGQIAHFAHQRVAREREAFMWSLRPWLYFHHLG